MDPDGNRLQLLYIHFDLKHDALLYYRYTSALGGV